MRRSVYDQLGGFRDIPIMEDIELVCELRRRHGSKILISSLILMLLFNSHDIIRQIVYLRRACCDVWPAVEDVWSRKKYLNESGESCTQLGIQDLKGLRSVVCYLSCAMPCKVDYAATVVAYSSSES